MADEISLGISTVVSDKILITTRYITHISFPQDIVNFSLQSSIIP